MSIKIRSFSFVTLILVAVIPVTVLSVTLYQQIYGLVSKAVHSQLEASVNNIESELSHQLAILTNGLSLLASKEVINNSIDDLIYSVHLNEELASFTNNMPLIESLYLLDHEAFVIESYKGNISILEGANLLQRITLSDVRAGQVEHMNKVGLLEQAGLAEQVGHDNVLAFVVPIYSDKSLNQVQVNGYLVAIVPIYQLLAIGTEFLEHGEQVSVFHNQTWLDGSQAEGSHEHVRASQRLIVSGTAYQNSVWLTLAVGQRAEQLDLQTHQTLSPGMTYSAIVILSLISIVMVIAHLISRSFGQLYALIHDVEKAGEEHGSNSTRFAISEFSELAALLARMRQTIRSQLDEVTEKNRELARIDKLRAAYLEEVQALNNKLESKVEARTKELENSLNQLAESSFFFQQLTQLRRVLESSIGNRQVVRDSIQILAACFPSIGFAVYIPKIHGHRAVFDTLNMQVDESEGLTSSIQSQAYPNWQRFNVDYQGRLVNVFGIRCGEDKLGWLLFNQTVVSEENANRIQLFTTELSSFLENRALNEELDFIARTDSLTGIKNRKAFDELQFELETRLDAVVGLFVIDVNGLKQMNDQKGHEKGDLLICAVAEVLNTCCNGFTQDFYRIGGDEFAIVLCDEQLSHAAELEAMLLSYQQRHLSIELDTFGGEPVVSFSVGYASTEQVEYSRLYKMADHQMYLNKQQFYSLLHQSEV